ncbi:MAG: HupE/UreJ family protein [Sediminibacterium sp.]|jgi:ABC-type antimicrobial peptide transport system permease subunit|nr:MAG: HupE/UreJ family protein [Sediminibacterium sp.]
MNDVFIFVHLGFRHIIDINGSDHMMFILALVIRYLVTDWKKILILVTSFTIGHSITLALSTLEWIYFPMHLIELLIPITILLTAISNLFVKDFSFSSKYHIIYYFALFFGLIHGLGFSNYLKSLLGKEESIVLPLFSFNIGLELGQLLIVGCILVFSFIFINYLKINRKSYIRIGSIITIGLSLMMIIDRINPFLNK